MALNILE